MVATPKMDAPLGKLRNALRQPIKIALSTSAVFIVKPNLTVGEAAHVPVDTKLNAESRILY
ncbi:MAG: hypothetical protein Cons2KO_26160 [Congregibacter sp.]